jgi:hypothetical protein
MMMLPMMMMMPMMMIMIMMLTTLTMVWQTWTRTHQLSPATRRPSKCRCPTG